MAVGRRAGGMSRSGRGGGSRYRRGVSPWRGVVGRVHLRVVRYAYARAQRAHHLPVSPGRWALRCSSQNRASTGTRESSPIRVAHIALRPHEPFQIPQSHYKVFTYAAPVQCERSRSVGYRNLVKGHSPDAQTGGDSHERLVLAYRNHKTSIVLHS